MAMAKFTEIMMSRLLGQDVWRWVAALTAIFLTMAIVNYFRRRATKLPTQSGLLGDVQQALSEIRQTTTFGIALYIGSRFLYLSPQTEKLFQGILVVALGIQLGLSSVVVARRLIDRYVDVKSDDRSGGVFGTVAEGVIWMIIGLLILSNLGIDVSGLMTSLGVGGIAVALAAQSVLGDLFASLSIVLDKPFEPGDFIQVGDQAGTVKRIGLKTTRVTALQGEELVFSNTDLLSSRIQNYRRMRERRVVLEVGLLYTTSLSAIKEVPGVLEEAIRATEGARFDRAHFKRFGDSALIFEAVYYIDTGDYAAFMDRQQAINMALLDSLRKRKLEFAFPTRTLHLDSLPKDGPKLVTSARLDGGEPTAA